MNSRPRFLLTLGFLLLSCLICACATNPVTGKKEFMLLSSDDEEQLGAESDRAMVAQYGLVDDAELRRFVEQIGARLVPVSHVPGEDFEFRLLDDPVVNAFALPGGFVFVTRGILAYLNDEAALAGIMGHEVGHVAARHGAQHYTQQILFGVGTGLGAMVLEDVPLASEILGTAGTLVLLKYSRDDEAQADALGVEYATKIGYDTRSMAEFFGTLEKLSGESRLPEWASTHPNPGGRHETVLRLSAEWQARMGKPSYRTDRNGYLRRLEGLVFGQNPRQGFEHGGEFVHPDLAFRFPIPASWTVSNTAAAVQLGEPNGRAAVLFELSADETDHDRAATAFAEQEGLVVTGRRSRRTAAGYPAAEVVSTFTTDQGTLALQSTFIGMRGRVYTFHGLAAEADFGSFRGLFTRVADGFGPLTDPALLGIQPVRIHVIEAERSASFREVVRGFPIPERARLDIDGLALLNGFGPNDTVPAGTMVKVLR